MPSRSSRSARLSAPADDLRTRYHRLYFPRNDARYLRRNALVAAGNSGDPTLLDVVAPFADGEATRCFMIMPSGPLTD